MIIPSIILWWITISHYANGFQIHGEVSRDMWKDFLGCQYARYNAQTKYWADAWLDEALQNNDRSINQRKRD